MTVDSMRRDRRNTVSLSKIALVAMGVVSVCWVQTVWREARSAPALDDVSGRVLQAEPFRPSLIQALASEGASRVSDNDRSETVREIAILDLRILEQNLVDAKRTAIDDQMAKTQAAIERSLRSAPADPFLWLSLYWLRTTRSGFSTDNLALLRMSYRTGPNEGWIALRRNRFSFIVQDFMPRDLLETAHDEFVALVRSGFVDATADILAGPAWSQREVLFGRLEDVPIGVRQRLARRLYDMGYYVLIPGVPRFGERPWR